MLEVFVSLLHSYCDHLKSSSSNSSISSSETLITLGELSITALGEVLSGCNQNAAVFRDTGGAKIVLSLVKIEESRDSALGLMQQLILAAGGDDDLTCLLELLHMSTQTSIDLKADILHTVIACLKESHRSRAVFRRVSGFVYIISVLVSLESSLADLPLEQKKFPDEKKVFTLLRAVFTCLTIAMRYEPANAKYFQVRPYASPANRVRLLYLYVVHFFNFRLR